MPPGGLGSLHELAGQGCSACSAKKGANWPKPMTPVLLFKLGQSPQPTIPIMPERWSQQALQWVLTFSLGISLGRLIRRWWQSRKKWDGLEGVVSHSSRVIAAWRWVETQEEDALFRDPFSAVLAGEAARQQALATAKAFVGDTSVAPWRRRYQISNVASRVWWFDKQLLAALSRPKPAASTGPEGGDAMGAQAVAVRAVQGGGGGGEGAQLHPVNVVVMGSGMDTRPWRLDLPPGVRWYEIDRKDVLEAKERALAQLQVQFSRDAQGPASAELHNLLRAESWAAVEADLCIPGWVEELRGAGFDSSLPTVWVLEGLLMYLTESQSDALLREATGSSAPGSTLVAHNCTQDIIDLLRKGEVDHPPFSQELMRTWLSGFPQDPSELLMRAGWQLDQAVSRAQIAAEICGGQPEGKCDFDTSIGQGRDRYAIFVVARTSANVG